MPAPESLKDIYADEMRDLWSANSQMSKVVKTMADKAHDPKLKKELESSITGINDHAEALKALLADAGEEVSKEHCKGMEGLCKEATKHIQEISDGGELLDITMLAQYQRMSHYGLAGFGTAEAYAKALGLKQHVVKLKEIVGEIYQSDQYASNLAAKAEKVAAKAA